MCNMYAKVLFLVLITTSISLVLCISSNNDDPEIFMVVDEQTSAVQPRKVLTKADNHIEIGRFQLEEGKLSTLSQVVSVSESCIHPNQQCGWLHRCCEGLSCNGAFSGTCSRVENCLPLGNFCTFSGGRTPCCYPNRCNEIAPNLGRCIPR